MTWNMFFIIVAIMFGVWMVSTFLCWKITDERDDTLATLLVGAGLFVVATIILLAITTTTQSNARVSKCRSEQLVKIKELTKYSSADIKVIIHEACGS